MILSPSILAADFNVLGKQIGEVEKAGAQYLHIDVMDGLFVPSISFGMPVIASIRSQTELIFDVHLMIVEPIRYIEEFVKAGAEIITFHLEAAKGQVGETIDKIHALGCKAGLSIKPGTPARELEPYLDRIDMVLIMTVEPGFGGQKYIPSSTEKIKEVKAMLMARKLDIDVEVDGGIGDETLPVVLEAGANVIVAGSSIFRGDIGKNIARITGMA